MRRVYSLLWYLAVPFLTVWMLQLALRDPGWRAGWRERLGLVKWMVRRGIWVHAASVGEVQAVLPLVQALRMRYPELPITFTAFTPSGRDHARRHFPEGVNCLLLPFDFPGAARRFVYRVRPRVAIVIETELWPNLYAALDHARIPLLVVSARITQKSERRYRRWQSLVGSTLAVPAVVSAQTDADAARVIALGADPTRVTVGGNVKFDFSIPSGVVQRAEGLRDELGIGSRRVWIAASTHDGEDAPVLAAHRAVTAVHEDAVLVLAPRHPGRADAVAALVERQGMRVVRRSSGAPVTSGDQVFLLDTLGELALFYGIADVAFVGGSLVPVGGHNLLEPAAFGLPLVSGPSVETVREMFGLLHEAGAVAVIDDADSLGTEVKTLLADTGAARRRGTAARRVLEQNRGAVERIMHLVEGVID